MISLQAVAGKYVRHVPYLECSSTDEKPLVSFDGIPISNGATIREIDTGDTYKFDEDLKQWFKQPATSLGGEIEINDEGELIIK